MSVIKKDAVSEDGSKKDEQGASSESSHRIPKEDVDAGAIESLDLNNFEHHRSGVIDRTDAHVDEQPRSVPAQELTPDHPLPEDYEHDPEQLPEEESTEADTGDSEEPAPSQEEWEERLEDAVEEARAEGREEGYEEGLQEGYDEGYADAQSELQDALDEEIQSLARRVAQLEEDLEAWAEDLEPLLVEMSVEVAETLLDAPLPKSVRGASARAIADAIEQLAGNAPLQVDVHPVDYQRLEETGMLEQLNANHADRLHWNPNPELAEGDWSVESPTAVVQHIRSDLLRSIRERLDTPDASFD